MEATNTTKTTEEYILKNWIYAQKMHKAYTEIILLDDECVCNLSHTSGNAGVRFAIEQAFLTKRQKTTELFELVSESGLTPSELKRFFLGELVATSKHIKSLLDGYNQLV